MPNGLRWCIILGQLVDERTGENIIEETVDLRNQVALRRLRPGLSPEDGEDLHTADYRPTSISELWCSSSWRRSSMDRHDFNRTTYICITSHTFSFCTDSNQKRLKEPPVLLLTRQLFSFK